MLAYTDAFKKAFDQMPSYIQKQTKAKITLRQKSPHHGSLDIHPLHGEQEGLFAMRIDMQYRILFSQEGSDSILQNIGTHDVYL